MSLRRFCHWAGPLVLLTFCAVPVNYLNIVFSTSTRWIFLALSLLLLLWNRSWLGRLTNAFGLWSLGFVLWSMMTYFWSEAPMLTIMKSLALALVVIAGIGSGALWVRQQPLASCLDCLMPVTLVVLFAGIFGSVVPESAFVESEVSLYMGLSGNPNTLGILAAMSLPHPIWRVFINWSNRRLAMRWGAIVAMIVAFLLLANSRAALITSLCIGLGLIGSLKLRKSVLWIIVGGLAVGVVSLLAPQVSESLENRYVYKSASSEDRDQGILSSRTPVWEESYEQAIKGGLVGGGYGVTIGEIQTFDGGFEARVGREKGNSQLGIMEETGVLGLLFYAGSTLSLFIGLIAKRRKCRTRELRALFGMIIGALFGMTVNSFFEAWYNAPGSYQCAYYWVLAGMGIALVHDPRLRKTIPLGTGLPTAVRPLPRNFSAVQARHEYLD